MKKQKKKKNCTNTMKIVQTTKKNESNDELISGWIILIPT